ncbi:hypothetical protein PSHT_14678 [Puccinia striiformis]|uniref:Alpha-type protein kinase domain-containing protein n=1 Tax=Puccinia striiformis TaxID=27350 RepID=A0A2S4UJ78_9BASI|nr:hypothetical protein PSHT_14678 [Puccinia striiformis]
MYCIDCGATPVRLGNWCQSCVNVSASIPSTLPAVAFQPPRKKSTLPAVAIQPPMNKPKSAHEIMRLNAKKQSNRHYHSNPMQYQTQSLKASFLKTWQLQTVKLLWRNSLPLVAKPHLSVGPYESARLSRMKPYNRPQVIKGAKAPKGPASKGIISSSLINTLCNKYNGSVELVTGPNKDRAKFVTEHFPYSRPRRAKWDERCYSKIQSLIRHISVHPREKGPYIRDEYVSEDEYNGSDSSLPSGDFSISSKVKNTTKTEKHPVDKHSDSKVMIKNSTSRSTSKPTKLIDNEIEVVRQPNIMELDDGLVFIRITPPWISNPILNPQDLSWDCFGTPENSLSLRNDKDLNWVNGVRYELNLDGLNTTQRICLYRVNYQNCLKLKSTSKIISAEILNSGTVFPMIAKYKTNFTWPNCLMRTYALARQFMAQICQEIKSSECATKLKQLAKKIRIIDGFPVHRDFETRSRSDDKFILGQDDDVLPSRVDSPDYSFYDSTLQLAEDSHHTYSSWRREYRGLLISCYQPLMIITHFKGNAPLIAKPRVIDLDPLSHWAHGVNTKNIISDFVQKHICTQACKRLGLPDLEEIHWSPKCGITNRESTNRESRSASINTQMNPEDIELISMIRQGKKALGFS